MLQRVMPDLMNLKKIMVMNDEGHHCYRRKQDEQDEEALKGEDKQEAKKNNEAARVWITGLETINARSAFHKWLTSPPPRSSCAAPATTRARFPLGERLLAHGRHRVRHRQAAARPRRRQHPRRQRAYVPMKSGPTCRGRGGASQRAWTR